MSEVERLRKMGACPEAMRWAEAQPPGADLWAACPRGDWLLWFAARAGGANHRLVLRAGAACAATALRCIPTEEKRPRAAIVAAIRWSWAESGSPSDAEAAHATAGAAHAAAEAARAADAEAARADGSAAYSAALRAASAARAAAAAAHTCADIAAAYAGGAGHSTRMKHARIVRAIVPRPA